MNVIQKIKGYLNRPRITEKDVLKYLAHKTAPIILEAGAADGTDTLRFSLLAPEALIYAFEPVSKNYNILKEKVKGCPNVKIYKMALGEIEGTMEIYISKNQKSTDDVASSSSLLTPKIHKETHPQILFEETEDVIVRTIDSWALENNIDHIDAMWLDMQGYEFQTLKASPEIMKTVKVIYTEVNFIEMYENCGLYEEYRDWLFSLGFKLVKKEFRWKEQGNALFIRNI